MPSADASMSEMPAELDRQSSDLFLNRELSLLEFNWRVLAQALDETVPILERLKFLCISSANLDEFFEIRVAGLQQMAELNPLTRGADGLRPAEILAAISTRARALIAEQYRVFNEVLLPALEQEQIRFVRRSEWSPEQDAWLHTYFQNERSEEHKSELPSLMRN